MVAKQEVLVDVIILQRLGALLRRVMEGEWVGMIADRGLTKEDVMRICH